MLHSAIKVNQPGKLSKILQCLRKTYIRICSAITRLHKANLWQKKTEKKSGSLKLQTIYILPSSIYSGVVAKN